MSKLRPKLNADISPNALYEYYWLKSELKELCKLLRISTSGGKLEILDRIVYFLKTGITKNSNHKKAKQKEHISEAVDGSYSLDSRVLTNFRCTREVRNFFESQVGKQFHFSVTLQKFIKANPGITFKQVIDEWMNQRKLAKLGIKKEIAPQFEFNQFTRDFFADPNNQGKTRTDCISAWKKARLKRRERKY